MTGIFVRATEVSQGWNGYGNKSQHRKLTLEKKTVPLLLQGSEPTNFRSRVLGRFSLYVEIHQSHMAQDSSSREGVAKSEGFPWKETLVNQILLVCRCAVILKKFDSTHV